MSGVVGERRQARGASAPAGYEPLAMYRRSCELDNSWGCFNLGMTKNEALSDLEKSCALKNARACNIIGVSFGWGNRARPVDRARAKEWFKKSCTLNDPMGFFKGCGNQARFIVTEVLSSKKPNDPSLRSNPKLVRARELAKKSCGSASAAECSGKVFGTSYLKGCGMVASNACTTYSFLAKHGYGGPRAPREAQRAMEKPCGWGVCEIPTFHDMLEYPQAPTVPPRHHDRVSRHGP